MKIATDLHKTNTDKNGFHLLSVSSLCLSVATEKEEQWKIYLKLNRCEKNTKVLL